MAELQVPTRTQLDGEVAEAEESYSAGGQYLVGQVLKSDDLTGW